MSAKLLHHAPWVIPVTSPVIFDGAVAVDGSRVIETGTFKELTKKHPNAQIISHENCVLLPALVNAHIHIELSHIPIPANYQEVNGFTGWIKILLAMRAEKGDIGPEAETAARQTLISQHDQGVTALGDIGNTALADDLRSVFPGILFHFNERLGRSAKSRKAILAAAESAPKEKIFTAHAPYSTHPELIRQLKKRANKYNHPFPIHVAEPSSENEMIRYGTGELADFLREMGFIDDTYTPPVTIDNAGAVLYLHELGVLDKRTICVHCIHVSSEEIGLIANSGAHVCLCPGSNRYLQVGKAPVKEFLDSGILPALGTDSLASNPEISLWREMNIINEEHTGINPAKILAMATLGGAKALGIDNEYGSLAPGRSSAFIAVPVKDNITDEKKLYELLFSQTAQRPIWVNEQ